MVRSLFSCNRVLQHQHCSDTGTPFRRYQVQLVELGHMGHVMQATGGGQWGQGPWQEGQSQEREEKG